MPVTSIYELVIMWFYKELIFVKDVGGDFMEF